MEPTEDPPSDRSAKLRSVGIGAAAGAVGFIGIYVWAIVLMVFATPFVDGFTEMQLILISTLGLGLGTLTGAVAYLAWSDRGVAFIDLSVPDIRDVAYAVVGLIGLFGALIAVSIVLQQFGIQSSDHGIVETAREGNPDILLWLIPASFLIIGPGEELLFRNVIQKSLYDTFSKIGAIVVSSVIFAAVHFSAYATGSGVQILISLGVVFVLSLLLGVIYARTENLLVPAFVHGAFNALQFAALYLQETGGMPT